MKKLLLFLLVLCTVSLNAQMTLTNGKIKVLSSGYLLNCVYATPKTYNTTVAYPLVIFCHGAGEAGTDINKVYNQGLPNVLKSGYQPPFDFIMAAPQASSYGVDPAWLPYILADVQSKYNIDKSRIYITGLSAGGWATLGSQMNQPTSFGSLFAAIAPLSAATQDLTQANYVNFKVTKTFVWDVVGANDVSYASYNQVICSNINSVSPGTAQFYTRPGIGHGGWIDIYNTNYKDPNGKTIWDFLYSHKLGNVVNPPSITSSLTSSGTASTSYNYTIGASNDPVSYAATGLPTGLNVNTSTGVISGTPVFAGTSAITISATNSGGTGSSTLSLDIAAPVPTVIETIQLMSDGTYKKIP